MCSLTLLFVYEGRQEGARGRRHPEPRLPGGTLGARLAHNIVWNADVRFSLQFLHNAEVAANFLGEAVEYGRCAAVNAMDACAEARDAKEEVAKWRKRALAAEEKVGQLRQDAAGLRERLSARNARVARLKDVCKCLNRRCVALEAAINGGDLLGTALDARSAEGENAESLPCGDDSTVDEEDGEGTIDDCMFG